MSLIPATEHARRRAQLMAQMPPGSLAVLSAAALCIRNRDVEYDFRQDSDFQYLSGFPEPDALLLLVPGRAEGEYLLFCRGRDPEHERWEGRRAGPEGALRDYAADQAFALEQLDACMAELLDGRDQVFFAGGNLDGLRPRLERWVEACGHEVRVEQQPLVGWLHEMRLYKCEAEVAVMRKAALISANAHVRAMQASRPGLFEYQLEAELEYEFRRSGARLAAYGSIVAGGANACILHYRENNARLQADELVLIDAGCELECYASDITRTFPVNGRFTAPQRALYEVVLQANLAAIDCVAPGRHWNEAHEASVRVITAGLVELGLLQGELEELIAAGAYKPFYMHRAGHWLGLDVHDVGEYRLDEQWRPLQPGMVLTIEPGIYVDPDNLEVAPQWRGIGIRIEDDVVVTEQGCEVLTGAVPKTVEAVEALMSGVR